MIYTDLLFQKYRKAIHGKIEPVGIVPNVIFAGHGAQQGKWLNEQLNKL
ncbi:MAG: hypothetical protein PHX09_03415 [Clostridia bacterium]|nr:hypothetical protein [Clostridia bacterium]